MVREFDMVGDHYLEPVRSVYDYPLEALLHVPNVNDVVERELTSVGRDFYQMVVRLVESELTLHRYFSLMVQRAGGYRCRLFTSDMLAIFVALNQIGAPGRYLIVTDSVSSLKALQTRKVAQRTQSLVYEIKEACWWLQNNGSEIHMMWIPSHVGARGNL
jgi:hypothetical protein